MWLFPLDYDVKILPHIYWLGFNHRSVGRPASCGYLLYVVFYLLVYQMVFFIAENWLSHSWDCFAWGELKIIFLYILLRKTDGSILGVLFWLINIGILIEVLSWIKLDMPDIIDCDTWIRTCRLKNNWHGFSSVGTNCEPRYKFWWINKWKWLKIVIQ